MPSPESLAPPQPQINTAPCSTSKPRLNFLFTHPRTASNLLLKILNLPSQPSLHLPPSESTLTQPLKHSYFFAPLAVQKFNLHGPLPSWSSVERTLISQTQQACFDDLNHYVNLAVHAGRDVFVSEHIEWLTEPVSEFSFLIANSSPSVVEQSQEESWTVQTEAENMGERSEYNKTVFPDRYLLRFRPTILIRHPGIVFPSLYRTGVDLQGVEDTRDDPRHVFEMSFEWLRSIHNFYLFHHDESRNGEEAEEPIVLDADDFIQEPALVRRYAEIVGLDPEKLRFEWEAEGGEERNVVERRMLSTLLGSSGVVKGEKTGGRDLNLVVEAEKWRVEFGEAEGREIEEWVMGALDSYWYLWERRLRL